MLIRLVPSLFVMLVLCTTSSAWAEPTQQDKDRAAQLVFAGDDLRDAGDHEAALKQYREADAIMGVPSTGIEVGRALIALGRLVEAHEKLEIVAEYVKKPGEPDAFDDARDTARKMAEELEERIPTVTVRVVGAPRAQVAVTIDAQDAPVGSAIRLDPGEHEIVARAGDKVARQVVTLAEREHENVSLSLSDPAEAERPPDETPASSSAGISPLVWVGFGVGGAGLLVGVITGSLAFERTNALDEICGADRVCTSDEEGIIDEAVALSHASTVSFIVGGLGVGFGVLMLVLSQGEDGPKEKAGLSPLLGPGVVGMQGRF